MVTVIIISCCWFMSLMSASLFTLIQRRLYYPTADNFSCNFMNKLWWQKFEGKSLWSYLGPTGASFGSSQCSLGRHSPWNSLGLYLKEASWYESTNVVWKVLSGLPGPCTAQSLLPVPRGLECLGVPWKEAACTAGSRHPEPRVLDRPSSARTVQAIDQPQVLGVWLGA